MALNYDYTMSKAFAEQIGLNWLGDSYGPLVAADTEAHELGLTQTQVDTLFKHHLWQIKTLFTPSYYKWYQRLLIAFYFLTGYKGKKK